MFNYGIAKVLNTKKPKMDIHLQRLLYVMRYKKKKKKRYSIFSSFRARSLLSKLANRHFYSKLLRKRLALHLLKIKEKKKDVTLLQRERMVKFRKAISYFFGTGLI